MTTSSPDKTELPPIPAKRYFTIGEVSELCGVKPHVLRYWEQEFTQLKPVKRRGNRLDEPAGRHHAAPAPAAPAADGFSLRLELLGIIELLRV
jgi:hypothetical protein